VNRSYVLRRLWLWPLVLWMRPLEVLDRSRTAPGLELTTAILGAGVWGALAGVALWLRTGDPQAIWVLSLAGAGAVTGVVATVSALGIALGVWLSASVLIYLFVPIALVFVAFSLKLAWDEHTGHETADWIGYTWITVFLVFLPIIAFALFPHSELNQIPQWGVALGIALSSGVIVGFFFDDDDGIAARGSTGDLRIGAEVQAAWLIVSWGLFLALAAVAYVLGPQVAELHAKLDRLALFLVLAPLVLTGLPAWPLTAVMALRQYGSRAGQASAPERLARTIAFRWQSFAYPLPGLESYLIRLGQDTGPAAALGAIQAVQFGTLQQAAARRAARKLASDPATALPFCGTVAVETNSATLATLVRVGTAGLAVAVLAAKQDQEDQDPLLLDPGKIRRRRFWPPLFWGTRNQGRVEDSEPDPARIRGTAAFGTDCLCRAEAGGAGSGRVGPRISGTPGRLGGARRSVGPQAARPVISPVGACSG